MRASTKSPRKWSTRWASTRDDDAAGQRQDRAGHSGAAGRDSRSRFRRPQGDPDAALQAMVFDSHYDEFRGAITYVRIMNGRVRKGQKIRFLRGGTTHEVLELGQFAPQRRPCEELQAGQVGYLICNIKSLDMVHIGDTVSVARRAGRRTAARLPGTEAHGLLRAVPFRRPGFRRTARGAGATVDQRSQFRVRAGNQRGAGVWISLRISGAAAHGDRPAAAGAGSGRRPGANRSQRDLRDHDQDAAKSWRSTGRRKCPMRATSTSFGSPSCASTSLCPADYIGIGDEAVPGSARYPAEARNICRRREPC